jgi:glycosyltransferase involved in cell wall biosynthesis
MMGCGENGGNGSAESAAQVKWITEFFERQGTELPSHLGLDPVDTVIAKMTDLAGKRVLLLFPHMVLQGGALAYALKLAEQLLARGATVAILTLRTENRMFRLPTGLEVIAFGGPVTSSLGYWLLFPYWQGRIGRAVTAWRPDVLVPQVFPANWWGWLYKRKYPNIKLVWVCQEPSAFIHSMAWIKALKPWWKSLLARVLRPFLKRVDISLVRCSDRILANSRFTAGEVERVYGRAPDGIAYPGIDFTAFSIVEGTRERAIITVGRLTRFKRVDFLLEVFKEVLKDHPNLLYHIIGTGEEELALRDHAKNLGVESRVIFHGAITDAVLLELYQRSLLFLHGSIDEPFGMAPLEAIACGTPVVAHRSGGPAEFVTAECGRLVGSLDMADWAGEITRYLDDLGADPGFPARVRECARRFDWPVSLRPAVEVIAGLCAENRRSARQSAGNQPGCRP